MRTNPLQTNEQYERQIKDLQEAYGEAMLDLKAMIKRLSAIEPAIGHMKMDGRLGRNPLKGAIGDALNAVLCGAGHNIRMLLKKLRLLCAQYGLSFRDLLQGIRQLQQGMQISTA